MTAISPEALADLLSRLVDSNQELLASIRSGAVTARYLREADAAIYCGFEKADKPDPQHRTFRRFCAEEGIKAKRGNGGRGYIFSKSELDRAMTTRCVSVSA